MVTKIDGVLPSKQTFQTNEWPIAAPTYIIMYKTPINEANQKVAFDFFKWAYANGDKIADELDYVPLSKDLKNNIVKEFK